MYDEQSASLPQKSFLVALHFIAVLASAWLHFGGGPATVGACFGTTWGSATLPRRALLLACSLVYFVRLLGTVFSFLWRKLEWWEAAIIGFFTWIINLTFSLLGGTRPAPLGLADVIAVGLYIAGSYLNTASECQRQQWKQRQENQGHLYTKGLFHWSMHINYFGDILLFLGWALLTYRMWAFVLPLLMLLGFVFVNIPMLDKHLHERYGIECEQYRRRTKRLIPIIY